MSQFLTVEETAQWLQYAPMTVYRLLKAGVIPGFKVGSKWRVRKETLEKEFERIAEEMVR